MTKLNDNSCQRELETVPDRSTASTRPLLSVFRPELTGARTRISCNRRERQRRKRRDGAPRRQEPVNCRDARHCEPASTTDNRTGTRDGPNALHPHLWSEYFFISFQLDSQFLFFFSFLKLVRSLENRDGRFFFFFNSRRM